MISFQVDRKNKRIMIYLSGEDTCLPAFLKMLFPERKKQGYLPVVLESGIGNLEDSLYLLMKRNIEGIAKNDVRYCEITQRGSAL